MRRAGAARLAIDRRFKPARLRPFLQSGLGVAQGAARLHHALGPIALHQIARGLKARVEIDRADDGFAQVAENGDLLRAARLRLAAAKAHMLAHAPFMRHVGAGLLAHEFGQALRQFAFGGFRKRRIEHVGHGEAQHAVAQKLEPLIRIHARALRRHGAHMGERAFDQAAIAEPVADPLLERGDVRLRFSRHVSAPA